MTFKEEMIPIIENNINKIMLNTHRDAIEFAPRGYHRSNSLRSSIFATTAIRRGQTIQASLIAKSEYAEYQHDEKLEHASPESGPAFLSFADFGTSSNEKTSYGQGYRQLKDSKPAYKSLFLQRAIFENFEGADLTK